MSEEEERPAKRAHVGGGGERPSLLNLRRWIPQRDVRALVLSRLSRYDVDLVRRAHSGRHVCALEPEAFFYHARCGHAAVLAWMLAERARFNDGHLPTWIATIIAEEGARGGHLDVVEQVKNDVRHGWAHVCAKAARNGHLHVIRWVKHERVLLEWGQFTPDDVIDVPIMRRAAKGGHIHILAWFLDERDARFLPSIAAAAAAHGQVETLRYLRAHHGAMDERVLYSKHPDVIRWVAETRDAN
jgi:hypothetical protein